MRGDKQTPHTTRAGGNSRRFDITLSGDTNLDLVMYGLPESLPTERELLAEDIAIRVGGSGAITAHNLAALGNSIGFITTVTEDEFGRLCHAELHNAGVDLSCCVKVPQASCGVTVLLQHQHARRMLTYAGATFHLSLKELDLAYLSNTRHFHMSSYYLQRALTQDIPTLFEALKRADVTISLDPNDDPNQTWDQGILDALRWVDVLMPNEREAGFLAGEPDIEKAISVLRERVPLLVIKRGAAGASAYAGSKSWHAPAHESKVIDAVGAGDSFNAGFLHAWIRGWSIEKALAFGNLAGAWSTTASGGTSAFREPKLLDRFRAVWEDNLKQVAAT